MKATIVLAIGYLTLYLHFQQLSVQLTWASSFETMSDPGRKDPRRSHDPRNSMRVDESRRRSNRSHTGRQQAQCLKEPIQSLEVHQAGKTTANGKTDKTNMPKPAEKASEAEKAKAEGAEKGKKGVKAEAEGAEKTHGSTKSATLGKPVHVQPLAAEHRHLAADRLHRILIDDLTYEDEMPGYADFHTIRKKCKTARDILGLIEEKKASVTEHFADSSKENIHAHFTRRAESHAAFLSKTITDVKTYQRQLERLRDAAKELSWPANAASFFEDIDKVHKTLQEEKILE